MAAHSLVYGVLAHDVQYHRHAASDLMLAW